MSVITLQVDDQNLTLVNSPTIASGSVLSDSVRFLFSEEWTGFSKSAVFYKDELNVFHQILDENSQAKIPNELLTGEGNIYIAVFGSKGEVTKTSEVVKYKIVQGAITENGQGSDITQSVYQQILSKIAELQNYMIYIQNEEIDAITK